MKLLYISDVHSDWERLECVMKYAEEVLKPDLKIISGDLVDKVFDEEDAQQHHEYLQQALMISQQEFHKKFALHGQPKPISPYEQFCMTQEFMRQILGSPRYPTSMKDFAEEYLLHLYTIAGRCYDEQYTKLLGIIGEDSLVLPGNYDINLDLNWNLEKEDNVGVLAKQNMHKKVKKIKGLKIAGYGGAGVSTGQPIVLPWIATELTVPFNEYPIRNLESDEVEMGSEPYDFFMEHKPDIVLTHSPPHGFCDETLQTEQNVGSKGLENYVKTGHSKLLLCGHIHEGLGSQIQRTNDIPTIVVNPGSITAVNGTATFSIVELDDETKQPDAVRIYSVNPSEPEPVRQVAFYIRKGMRLEEVTLVTDPRMINQIVNQNRMLIEQEKMA